MKICLDLMDPCLHYHYHCVSPVVLRIVLKACRLGEQVQVQSSITMQKGVTVPVRHQGNITFWSNVQRFMAAEDPLI
jgi:hypothetical protein